MLRFGSPIVARTLYGLVVIVRIVTLAWAATQLPDRIATHFGASGAADGWGTREGYLALDIALSAALVLGLPMLAGLLARGSGAGINIPHKDYWLRPENRERFRARLSVDMLFFGGATGLLLSWVDVELVRANALAVPALGNSIVIPTVIFVVAMLAYSVWMVTVRYAVPAR